MLFILSIIALVSGVCLLPKPYLEKVGIKLPRDLRMRRLYRFVFFFSLILICLHLKIVPFALILGVIAVAMTLMERFRERMMDNEDLREDPDPAAGQRRATPPPPRGAMEPSEALSVLGLKEGATGEEVDAAYKRLISQLHPDKGGTDYLAAKLNEARSVLKNRLT